MGDLDRSNDDRWYSRRVVFVGACEVGGGDVGWLLAGMFCWCVAGGGHEGALDQLAVQLTSERVSSDFAGVGVVVDGDNLDGRVDAVAVRDQLCAGRVVVDVRGLVRGVQVA